MPKTNKVLFGLEQYNNSIFVMVLHMSFIVWKQFKVFYSIIILDTVDMMDDFFCRKNTSQQFFHYNTMLKDFTSFVSKGMLWLRNIDITMTYTSSAFPKRVLRACARSNKVVNLFLRPLSAFIGYTHFSFGFFRMMCSSFSKTNLSFPFFRKRRSFTSFEFAGICNADFPFRFFGMLKSFWHWHNNLQINKAAFSELMRTQLSAQRLLTAFDFLGITAFPLAFINITHKFRVSI